jgi:zinc protease
MECSMFTFTRVAAVALVAGLVGTAAGQGLPEDPALVKGELENGLRYIVRKHANPPGKAIVWMHVSSGSLNETAKQRGLAHYLEHLAFNGSENFPPGQVVPFFQSLGMTFGRDQNAFTNMTQTVYQLTLPRADEEILGKGMMFFSDIVSKLSLLPKEVEAEKQIILEERRRGLSGRQRAGEVVMKRTTPGSIYGERNTIGTEETIRGATQEDFKDYYGKWYTASNATVMVVADAEPADVVKVIKEKFGGAPKRPRPVDQAVGIKAYDRSFAVVATDPEIRGESLDITWVMPPKAPTTTVAGYRSDLVLRLGEQAFNRRMGDKEAKGGVSFAGARVSARNQNGVMYEAGISGRAASSGKWKPALEEMSLELQRGRAFGFSERELSDVKQDMVTNAERAVETEGTVQASQLIGRLNGAVGSEEPVMSPKQRLDLLKELLPKITGEEVAKRFAEEFEPKAVAFVAVMPTGEGVPTEEQLLDIGTKALAVKPSQESESVHGVTSLMKEAPTGGTITESTEHAATQVHQAWLGNGARVNYRFMDQQKNQVSINISLIGGELLESAATRGITSAAQLAWSRPATKNLTSTDIRDFMNGKKVSVRGGGGFGGGGGRGGRGGGGGGGDSISLSISGNPEQLETGFQLAYMLLTEPKIEQTAFDQFKTRQREALAEEGRSPQAVGMRAVAAATYPETEARTKRPTVENIERLTITAAQEWLEKLIKESPIEVTIVGDVPREKAMELVSKYIGALSAREKVSPKTYAGLRQLERAKGGKVVEKTVDTQTDQAFVYSGFYNVDESDRAAVRAMAMAARVLSTRMTKEVREEAQLVYSIGASSRPGTTYPGFGVFAATAPTDPQKTSTLTEKLASMFEKFAKEGPSEEEMIVAKKQMANTIADQIREPGYWSGRLNQITFRGASLDDIAGDAAAYQAISGKEVQGTFAKQYSKDSSIVVVVKPSGKGGPAAKDGGEGTE